MHTTQSMNSFMTARCRTFALLVTSLLATSAVLPAMGQEQSSAKDNINIVFASPMTSFNQNVQSLIMAGSVAELVLEGLTQYVENEDGTLELAPELATEWELVEPNRWRFKLRQATFSDGTPLTSADVLASVHMLVVEQPGTYSSLFNNYTLEAPDDSTIDVITQGDNEVAVPIRFSMLRVFPATQLAELGPAGVGQTPIGTGPYKVDSFEQGVDVALSYNSTWWGDEPNIKTANIRFITDASTRVSELRSGSADLINFVPPVLVPQIESDSNLKTIQIQPPGRRTLFFNVNSGVSANPEFRRALQYAVNREELVQAIGGHAVPNGGIYSTIDTIYDPDYRPFPYDPDKAREILAAAGIVNPRIDMYVRNDQETTRIGAQALQAQLAEIGVQVNVLIGPNATTLPQFTAGELPGMYFGEFSAQYPGEDRLFSSHFVDNGAYNKAYHSDAATPLIVKLRSTRDPDERKALLEEIQRLVVEEESLWVPLYIEEETYAAVRNLNWHPLLGLKLGLETASFE